VKKEKDSGKRTKPEAAKIAARIDQGRNYRVLFPGGGKVLYSGRGLLAKLHRLPAGTSFQAV